MEQYINKNELEAEIQRRKQVAFGWMEAAPNDATEAEFKLCDDILSFLNTLEVKEVVAEQKGICNGILNTIVGDTTWNIKIPLDKAGLKHGDKVKIFITKEK